MKPGEPQPCASGEEAAPAIDEDVWPGAAALHFLWDLEAGGASRRVAGCSPAQGKGKLD